MRNYAWSSSCIRQWLWIPRHRRHRSDTWMQRMEHAVKMTLSAVLCGASILIHCRTGKNRSGAFGCFVFALLCGCTLDQARLVYMSRNRRVRGHDLHLASKIMRANDMSSALEHFRLQEWVVNTIGNILHKIFAPSRAPYPAPKRMPLQRSGRSRSPAPRPMLEVIDAEAGGDARPLSSVRQSARERAIEDVLRESSPEPPVGRRSAWTCADCSNVNSRHTLCCSRAGCSGQVPQVDRPGDWTCFMCGNSNRYWHHFCKWMFCPSNDWECPSCGIWNFGDRQVCSCRDLPCTQRQPWTSQE